MSTLENFNHILLFKTNINCDTAIQLLHNLFDGNTNVKTWSVDIDDEDCVLRIISYTLTHSQIINLIKQQGYQCAELI